MRPPERYTLQQLWKNITPAEIDAAYEKYGYGNNTPYEDLQHTLRMVRESWNYRKILAYATDQVMGGTPIPLVLEQIAAASLMFGWYVRDDRQAAAPIDELMDDKEMELLRAEIRQECPVRPPVRQLFVVPPSVGGEWVME